VRPFTNHSVAYNFRILLCIVKLLFAFVGLIFIRGLLYLSSNCHWEMLSHNHILVFSAGVWWSWGKRGTDGKTSIPCFGFDIWMCISCITGQWVISYSIVPLDIYGLLQCYLLITVSSFHFSFWLTILSADLFRVIQQLLTWLSFLGSTLPVLFITTRYMININVLNCFSYQMQVLLDVSIICGTIVRYNQN
jgi:hypothetical protein